MNQRENRWKNELRKAELSVMIFKEGAGVLACRPYKLPLSDYALLGELASEAEERLLSLRHFPAERGRECDGQ